MNNLWRYGHQSRHAQRIADRAGRLYDKMRLFVDDMTTIGQNLTKAQDSYQQAMKKLSEGRGNLIAQTEGFRQMGVEVKRPINPLLAGQAVSEGDDETTEQDDNQELRVEAGDPDVYATRGQRQINE